MWELPLSRALQYYHCALRTAMLWTVPPSPKGSVNSAAERLHQRMTELPPETDDTDD